MAASLARQEGSIVVATMRKVNAEITSFYNEIKSTVSGRVVLTELDLLEPEAGFAKLGRTLSDVGITHLDVVIANAGASAGFTPTLETTGEDLLFDFKINTVATLGLFQLTWPLLEKSSSENPRSKKFVYITSSVGSIASLEEENFPGVSYGVSKAGANWMLKKIAVEYKEKGLKVGIIHPGYVYSFCSIFSRRIQLTSLFPYNLLYSNEL